MEERGMEQTKGTRDGNEDTETELRGVGGERKNRERLRKAETGRVIETETDREKDGI